MEKTFLRTKQLAKHYSSLCEGATYFLENHLNFKCLLWTILVNMCQCERKLSSLKRVQINLTNNDGHVSLIGLTLFDIKRESSIDYEYIVDQTKRLMFLSFSNVCLSLPRSIKTRVVPVALTSVYGAKTHILRPYTDRIEA